jgi:hypothetical protein
VARHPTCPLQVFRLCKQVADSADAVIQKQRFANVDRRAPAIVMPLCPLFLMHLHPDKNRISQVGLHRGECRLILPGLTSRQVSQQSWGDVAQRTYIDMGYLTPRQSSDMHDLLSSTSLPDGDLLKIDDPGRVGDDGRRWAMLEYGRET